MKRNPVAPYHHREWCVCRVIFNYLNTAPLQSSRCAQTGTPLMGVHAKHQGGAFVCTQRLHKRFGGALNRAHSLQPPDSEPLPNPAQPLLKPLAVQVLARQPSEFWRSHHAAS